MVPEGGAHPEAAVKLACLLHTHPLQYSHLKVIWVLLRMLASGHCSLSLMKWESYTKDWKCQPSCGCTLQLLPCPSVLLSITDDSWQHHLGL